VKEIIQKHDLEDTILVIIVEFPWPNLPAAHEMFEATFEHELDELFAHKDRTVESMDKLFTYPRYFKHQANEQVVADYVTDCRKLGGFGRPYAKVEVVNINEKSITRAKVAVDASGVRVQGAKMSTNGIVDMVTKLLSDTGDYVTPDTLAAALAAQTAAMAAMNATQAASMAESMAEAATAQAAATAAAVREALAAQAITAAASLQTAAAQIGESVTEKILAALALARQ
jgi:hypothetical protein